MEFEHKSDLVAQLQTLKVNPAYTYLTDIISKWKIQAIDEIMLGKSDTEERTKGEYLAYGRVLNLLEISLAALQDKPDTSLKDFDAYQKQ